MQVLLLKEYKNKIQDQLFCVQELWDLFKSGKNN